MFSFFVFSLKLSTPILLDIPFLSLLEVFQALMQYHPESLGMCGVGSQSEQGFYLIRLLLIFFIDCCGG